MHCTTTLLLNPANIRRSRGTSHMLILPSGSASSSTVHTYGAHISQAAFAKRRSLLFALSCLVMDIKRSFPDFNPWDGLRRPKSSEPLQSSFPPSFTKFRLDIYASTSTAQDKEADHCLANFAAMASDPNELLWHRLARHHF